MGIDKQSRAGRALEEIRNEIPSAFPVISEIRLFGSYAHGTNNSRSDLDILILTQELIKNRTLRGEIRDCIDSIAMRYRMDTDVVFYSFETYQKDNSRFTVELRKSKLIYRR